MARAGLRLRYLYQLYQKINQINCQFIEKDFYTSRLCCAKSCLYTDFDYVSSLILKEYQQANGFSEVFECIIKTQDLNQYFDPRWNQMELSQKNFKVIYQESPFLRDYFWQQHQKLKKYLDNLLQGKEKIILVDSGWVGNTQGMLMRSFSQYQWRGLYFAKWAKNRPKPAHFDQIEGISIDESVHSKSPRSCIFSYPLLIEAILELNFPSTEEYKDYQGTIIPNAGIASESMIAPNLNDPYFLGIVEYFKEQTYFNVRNIHDKANEAYKHLFRLIKFPKKSEVSMMEVSSRSVDFGKKGSFPILQKAESISSIKAKRDRIRRAQWKPGQVALECPFPIDRLIQLLKVFTNF